eukprot:CAMPEP_0184866994 /NCGR_PEP_ID=MMETSP0580-20130426/24630_1 /TAXON_ID=1118495 /ORGANISM="Dactyliosolen fragilissimus" /LENGTH=194 /DNA_ID=CAMNT_0027366977 /DNA_START=179 /DNA_END=763 /DNA_ORIENTATION=+
MCSWAFKTCDTESKGELTKSELYCGLILVYLNLSKYVGPAACFPPSREVVGMLFDLSDEDKSGGINEHEFSKIVIILSSQLTWRIVTYYAFLIMLVPYIVRWIIALLCFIGVDDTIFAVDKVFDRFAPASVQNVAALIPESVWNSLPQTLVRTSLFVFVIPYCWDGMDSLFQYLAKSDLEKNIDSAKQEGKKYA